MGIETELEKIIDGDAVVDERREGGDDVLLNKTKVFNVNTQFCVLFLLLCYYLALHCRNVWANKRTK